MMKLRSALTLATIALAGSALGTVAIYAQAESELIPPSKTTRSAYVSTLTTYRTDEQAFSVAKREYEQLQTLGKLEVAVNTFRTVQASRAKTMVTYYETLLSMVSEAKGMEVSKKEALMEKLRTAIAEYKALNNESLDATDRVALEATAKKFTDKQTLILSLDYETLALLRITAMQSALDQMQVAIDLVKKQSENLSETQKAEKQRGFDELSRRMDIVRSAITKANDFHDRIAGDENYSESSYSQLTDGLNLAYPELRQAENFLRELAGK